jgi:flagellar biosynthesis/type III secretory pathway protein FliH
MIHHIQVVQQEEYQRYWDDGVAHGIKQGHAAGLTEGLTQGLSQGLSKGQERMNRLIELLVQDNRQDDLLRSVNDPAFQEELMREYGLEQ